MKLLEKYPTRRLPESGALFKVGEKVGYWPYRKDEGSPLHGIILEILAGHTMAHGPFNLYKIDPDDPTYRAWGITHHVPEKAIYSLKPF